MSQMLASVGRLPAIVAATFVLLLGLPLAVRCQGVNADIRGSIRDQSGAAIADATITLENTTKGSRRTAKTDNTGAYQFLQIPPADTLNIVVESAGFQKEVRSGVVLQTGQQSRVDLTLTPGQLNQTVTVEENASLVQSENAAVGAVVDERRVKELPLNGRQFWQLAQLLPNVFSPTQNSALSFRGGFNVAGNAEVNNNYVLDGIDNADEATMQPTNRPSVDGIQEFRVLTGTYGAEYGRFSGGQVLVTTKAGTNEFHGTAYEFLRNSALDSRNFFSPGNLPPFRRNQFGLSNGGRIIKNRTFYFVTYEGLRLSNGVQARGSVPTERLRRGDVSEIRNVRDPLTGQPFLNNQIPASRLNPVSQQLLQYWPLPTRAGTALNYTLDRVGTQNDNQFSGRIDQTVSSKNNLFVSYQFAQRETFYPSNTLCSSRVLPNFGCTEPERDQLVSINDTHVFSPSFVNELRMGINRIRTNRFNEDAQFGNVVQQLGLPQGTPNGLQGPEGENLGVPEVSISGFATIGGPTNLPQGRRNTTYNLIDSVSYTRGKHTIKAGVDYKHFIYNLQFWQTGRGSFNFNGQYTGAAISDFLLGNLRSAGRAPGDPGVNSYTTSTGFFVQDDWKVTPRLTLNYGMRYELFFPQRERLDKISSFDPATGLVPVADGRLLNVDPASGTLINVGQSTLTNSAWRLDKNNLAPRFGFAWRPAANDKTVVRGGYGIFYNLLPDGNGISQLFRGIPFRTRQTFTNTLSQTFSTWNNPFPSGAAGGGFTPNGINGDFQSAYVQQWSFGVQRELHRDLVFEATYLGSKGSHLPLSYNLNQPSPGPGALQPRRPYSQWGPISWVDAIGTSNFNSLALRVERRYAQGLSIIGSYTYSHSIDLGPSPATSGDGETGVQDPRNIRANRGSSEFDIRHRFVGNIVYELPFGKGKSIGNLNNGLIRTLISGWQVTSIVTAQQGAPFTVITSRDISNTGGSNRPFVVGNWNTGPQTSAAWFNTAAFSDALPAGVFSYGNAGRNTLRGDGLLNWDFGLYRNIPIRERIGLQFRAEAFNVLNHTNFGLPDRDVNSQTFGQISQTSTSSRQIQFGLKLLF